MDSARSALTRVLVTGGDSPLARAVIAALPPATAVRVVDRHFTAPFAREIERSEGDLRDQRFVGALVTGVDAVLHLAPLTTRDERDLEVLDQATLGTYRLAMAAQAAGAARVVLASTLAVFDTFPTAFQLNPSWRPRPRPDLPILAPWLAERSLREIARATGLAAVCLRLGTMDAAQAATALLGALNGPLDGWRVDHSGDRPLPAGPPRADLAPMDRPRRRVVVFGAGGPLAAATAALLAPDYLLRLTDVAPLAELATRPPQSPGAPLPVPLGPPHEERVVDVRDPDAVLAACEGMDAIVNCTVVRHDPVDAWRVNLLGAHNILHAAVAHGIRRVVQTGPCLISQPGASGYTWDELVGDDPPPRPGHDRYLHTKYLAQELCRAFAEYHGLEVPVLQYAGLASTTVAPQGPLSPFFVSWTDAGRAIRHALEVPSLPTPCEVMHITADLPHGVFPNRKAKHLLGWHPRDTLEQWYSTARPEREA
ncbi:MAG: uronate dehydrogenase [Thermomicrobiales bacterium]|nr:uronate dehydrogenase [Thermomicrobiales bacterium]